MENNYETNNVCTSNSNGGKVAGLVLGAIGVLGGIAAAVIYKKKKAQNKVEEADVEDNEDQDEE